MFKKALFIKAKIRNNPNTHQRLIESTHFAVCMHWVLFGSEKGAINKT